MTNHYTRMPAPHKNRGAATRNLLRLPALMVLMLLLISGKGWGQSTVFSDDFGRGTLTPGGTPSMTYTIGSTTNPAGITAIASGVLQQYGPVPAVNGREYFMGLSSTFSYPYISTTLNSNPGVVTWSFNIRTNRTSSSLGFDAVTYGGAVILATNNTDPTNVGASGYAVVLRRNVNASNAVTLVSFAGGLTANANTTAIIGPSPDLAAYGSHVSVKVVYTPSTDTWQLFYRDDLANASVDPLSGTLTQVGGDVVNSAYTNSASYSNFGFFYNHSTATSTSNKANYDNFKVQVNVPVTWTSGWPKAESPTPTGFTAKVNANVSGTSYYVVLASGASAPSSAQVKAGQDASGAAATASGSIACAAGSTEYSAAAGGSLANSTTYDVYFVAQDASGSNLQASPVKVSFTTTGSASAPLIQDPTATAITNSLATLGGNITSDGGSALTERGTVWNTLAGVTIADNKEAEGLTATGIFTQSRILLPAKSHIYYKAYATNSVGTTLTNEGNFFTKADEPLNQVTFFAANPTSPTTVDLSWTAAADADGYFILQRQSSAAPSGVPNDATIYPIGTTLGLGSVAAYVTSGATTTITLSGLTSNSIYTFRIMSVNSDGVNAGTYNYFTTAGPTATATTLIPPAVTYTWNQTGTASWATASNWTPTRTTPEIKDILQFNGGGSIIVTDVPNQTVGQLLISNITSLELQSAATVILNIGGEGGVDFDVPTGSSLTIAQALNGISIALATGTTGTVGGSVTFSNSTHRLTAVDASAITFQNGATFTSGASFSGNAFGTTGNNSVVFEGGSKYVYYAGGNPFGATAPASAVTWNTGSTYVHRSTGSASFSNRTYADFELDIATSTTNTASNPVTMDNLSITSGTLNLGVSNTFTIKGNISIPGTALNLNPAAAGTVVLSGTSPQLISGTGTITTDATAEIIFSNVTGVTLASGTSLITNGAVSGNITVQRDIPAAEWHLVSAPVSNAVSGMFTGKYLQTHTELTDAYTDITSTSDPLTPMKGFAVYDAAGFTASFAGTLNTGAQSIGITKSGSGWNLVGNPYPSSIDWDAASGWTKTDVNAATYIHVNSATWASYVGSTGTNGGTNFIAPCQGFFVEATSAGTLAMDNAVRVHNATTFFKSKEAVSNLLRLEVSGNTYKDEAVVRFLPEATANFDGNYDAHKFYGDVAEAAQLYTLGSTPLAINTLPEANTVPVGVRARANGTYTIAATEIRDIPVVALEDTKTGIFTNLQNESYTFNMVAGENEQRFVLHFGTTSVPENGKAVSNIYSYQKTVFISLKEQTKGDIFVYTVAGQLVTTKTSARGMNEIKLPNTGNYIVKVVTKDNTVVRKVWIQ